jgi:dTDP-4-dehydrorhamnose reductase
MSEVIVFGSEGLLGSNIKKVLEENGHTVIDPKVDVLARDENEFCDGIVAQTLYPPNVKYVINCIAFSNVDAAEQQKDLCRDLNEHWPKYLSLICNLYNKTLIHFSSDFVFNSQTVDKMFGDDFPINENVHPKYSPQNNYGLSKLLGDSVVRGKAIVLRISWLFGKHYGTQNVRDTFMHIPLKKNKLSPKVYGEFFGNTYGTPTYAADVANFVCDLVEGTFQLPNETFNFANKVEKPITKLAAMQMALRAYRGLKSTIKMQVGTKNTLEELKPLVEHPVGLAKRPFNSALKCEKLPKMGVEIPTLENAIERFVLEVYECQ